ncbi:MAG: peptidyl-prolyl cis-trans isomerase [Lachnospiraceae bacterium]
MDSKFKSHKNKYKWRACLFGCMIVAFIAAYLMMSVGINNMTVAAVNNEAISVREFKNQLIQKQAEVENYFKVKYGVSINKQQWNDTFEGEVPIEVLKEWAIRELTRIKVQQIMAREAGLTEDISYQSFLQELKAENEKRAEMQKNNQVIYGSQQYSEQQYFAYIFSNMVIQLKSDIAKEKLLINDEILQKYFKQRKSEYTGDEYLIEIEKLFLSYADEDGCSDSAARAAAKSYMEGFMIRLNQGETFKNIVEHSVDPPMDNIQLTEETFEKVNERYDTELSPVMLEQARALNLGEYSNIFEENNGFSIIRCVTKEDGEPLSFEKVKEQVRYNLIDDIYEKQVDSKVNEAEVTINSIIYNLVDIN